VFEEENPGGDRAGPVDDFLISKTYIISSSGLLLFHPGPGLNDGDAQKKVAAFKAATF